MRGHSCSRYYSVLFQIEKIDIDCLTNKEFAQFTDWIIGFYRSPTFDTIICSSRPKKWCETAITSQILPTPEIF
ncbi:unnamed protein product [Haemonchus placei]|uniref:Uncharacterized protein n=1 Tax=Haemonchus placei TaxID=6290 RepID=A0A3P7UGN9_HAEPC|nr:unnamed protein product [Haemonchus placei]